MSLINKLTPQQERAVEETLSKWLAIGRSTAPLDRPAAARVITKFYAEIKKPAPTVLFFSSPLMCLLAYGALKNTQLNSQLNSQVWSQLWSQLRSQLSNCFGGHHWCAWEVFYHFCNQIGATYTAEEKRLLDLWLEQSKELHWWFPYDGIVFASERHTILNVDDRGRLHSDKGQAVGYSDGWGLWLWHRVIVPQDVIEKPSKITVKQVESERNAEVRRVMIERYGQPRYLKDSGAELVNSDVFGKLWRKEIPNDEALMMVELLNSTPEKDGSVKTYFLRVPPDMKTAHEAVAWTFNKKQIEYAPIFQS